MYFCTVLKIKKISVKINTQYCCNFNPLQKYHLIFINFNFFPSNLLELTKILIIFLIFPIFKKIKLNFCKDLKMQQNCVLIFLKIFIYFYIFFQQKNFIEIYEDFEKNFRIFTWNIEKIKNIIKILVNLSKYDIKMLNFK